jgi:hypothetical protein
MENESARFYALQVEIPVGLCSPSYRLTALCQFHPEVTHTTQGMRIYSRFVHDICGCGRSWNSGNIVQDLTTRVSAQVGSGKVLLGLSGGVDSSVVAALLHLVIGSESDLLLCLYAGAQLTHGASATDVCVCRSRSAAPPRGGPGDASVCEESRCARHPRRCR